MKRYLCPICDRELTAKSYCKTCRKMVKTPIIYDGILPNEDRGNYLLNHQNLHPDRACVEANRDRVCETPQEKRLNERFEQARQTIYKAAARTPRAGQSTAPGSQIWRNGTSTNTYTAKKDSSTSRKRKKGWAVIVAVFAVISMLGDLVSELDVDSWFEPDYEYVQEEPAYSDESIESVEADDEDLEWDEDVWETVDYADILATGERCNGYWHYSMDGKDMYEQLVTYVSTQMQLVMTDQSEYMSNDVGHYEDGDYTYYEQCYYWDWEDGYLGVGCDSVTGETHYVYCNSWDADLAIDICMKAFSIVEGEDSAAVMAKSLTEVIKADDIEDGYFFDMGDSTVWICKMSEGYYTVEISPVTE